MDEIFLLNCDPSLPCISTVIIRVMGLLESDLSKYKMYFYYYLHRSIANYVRRQLDQNRKSHNVCLLHTFPAGALSHSSSHSHESCSNDDDDYLNRQLTRSG